MQSEATTQPPPPPGESTAPPNFWGDMPEEEYYASQGVRHTDSYFDTPNGTIYTQSFRPLDETQPVKATVFMTHGYGTDSGWLFQRICISVATWGYHVFAADLLGHGRSEGIRGYIGDMEKVAATSLCFFKSVRYSEEYKHLPAFLFGESMGGLITTLMYLQSEPGTWTGLVLSSPLLVIPENRKPSKALLFMYGLLFGQADTWAAMPNQEAVGNSIRDLDKLKIMARNPRKYVGKPRVGTMREIANKSEYVQKNFDKITVPFLVAHGTADGVASPAGAEMLYEKARSEDKTLKLYEGLYHSLIQGEPDEDANRVLADVKAWLDERAAKYGPKHDA
nr:caffeoylshikimate esterase-like [Ipomoea batatas]GMD35527.1 caffeoylshikimate esterase-like [Ipomoea batatas]GMD38771.1 caffeoylshikimate esterase-like [Ipomoea batatas]GME00842.1 caffeoylshikimate esterase-like [Ipomoea batatas]